MDNIEFLVVNGKEKTSQETMINREKHTKKDGLPGLTFFRFIFPQELFIDLRFINCAKISARSRLHSHPECYQLGRKKKRHK